MSLSKMGCKTCKFHLVEHKRVFFCNGCKQVSCDTRVHCDKCDYNLHMYCVLGLLSGSTPRIIYPADNLPVDRADKFVFLRDNPFNGLATCDACGKCIRGFSYHCKEKRMVLHPICSQLKGKFNFNDGTEFVLMAGCGEEKKCEFCKAETSEAKRKDSRDPGWSYFSVCGNRKIHLYCICKKLRQLWKNDNSMASEPQRCRASLMDRLESKLDKKLETVGQILDKGDPIVKTCVGFLSPDPATATIITSVYETVRRVLKD